MPSSGAPLKNARGFSFIELLIGMGILAMGMLAALSMQFGSVRNNTKGNIYTQATMLAKTQLETLKNQNVSGLVARVDPYPSANPAEIPLIDEFGNVGGIFRRSWTIANLGTDARRITVTVQWTRLGRPGHSRLVLQHQRKWRMIHRRLPELVPAKRKPWGLSEAGFSMIEMILALGALAIMFGAIYAGFERLNRSYVAENVKAGTQQSARIGVEMMVQDIRLAGLNPLGTAGAGVVAADPTSFRFTADVNFDGDLEDAFEDITYALNGSTLEQTSHLGTEVLLEDVTGLASPTLTRPAPAAGPRPLAEIRSVGVTLTLNRPAGRDQVVSRTYNTQVRCRNL